LTAEPKKIKENLAGGKRGRKAGAILFPRDPLTKVLPIAEAIWKNNAGRPLDILDVAKAVDQSPTSSTFVRQLASSFRYGLTEGSPTTKVISLTSLGSSIVAPTVETDVKAKLREALLNPQIFKQVYTWLDRKPIPREDVFRNTLMKPPEANGFGLLKEDLDEFITVFTQNIKDYHLEDDHKGTIYLRLDLLAPATQEAESPDAEGEEIAEETPPQTKPAAVVVSTPVKATRQIFVAHGKNKVPLEQLKSILTQFKVPFQVAIDEPHKGRPISAKVLELMRDCTSGIFIFTADEETKDAQGNICLRPSDNVVFELGAGTVLYGDKIVIFRESGVAFGSDFTDYGHITFEKDKLEAKAFDLMKELIGLDFLQVTPK
jgi:predicted nucleotide-binding protein